MVAIRHATRVAGSDRSRLTLALVGAAGLCVTTVAVAVVLSTSEPGDRPLIALGRGLVIAVPIAVGLWARLERPDDRFGRLLVAAGFAWSLTAFAESNNEVLYSIGRVGLWLAEPILLVLLLTFPSGRLTGRLERGLVCAAVGLVAVLYLPTALLVERYPEPSPASSCGLDCPDNAFILSESEPSFTDAWLIPLRDLLSVAVFVTVLVLLARRVQRATQLMRRALVPVLAVALVQASIFVVYVPLRRVAPESPALEVLAWLYVLCLPAMALAFMVGILRSELLAGTKLQRLALGIRRRPSPTELVAALREAMEDPSLELVYWIDTPVPAWVDPAGTPVVLPSENAGRCLTEVVDGERRVAGLIHDAALLEQHEFVQAASSLALTSLENHRLAARVDASLAELRESRARIQAAADSERQRIERDLHDGAQQRLVALRIRLGLAGDLMRENPARGAELLVELGAEAEAALDDVRSLAQGVYPALLSDKGLPEALRDLARRNLVAATVDTGGIGRYPREVESAVYFCCLEALQNAAKHAHGAKSVAITVRDDGELRFEVRDDGIGFAAAGGGLGVGLTNMRDRLAAVGGEFSVESKPGHGTRVTGRIPR
jgi:signal transduction histidine kinase